MFSMVIKYSLFIWDVYKVNLPHTCLCRTSSEEKYPWYYSIQSLHKASCSNLFQPICLMHYTLSHWVYSNIFLSHSAIMVKYCVDGIMGCPDGLWFKLNNRLTQVLSETINLYRQYQA